MAVLSPPYLLGANGQVLSGRLGRLSLGGVFRPATSGVQVTSGVLAGPPNTQGELSLAGSTLTVQPYRAVIQSALDATAGSYEVINDAPVNFTLTAQHATQFRRSLIVTRVDDSQVSGVASSGTTDRATLEVLDGGLAASAGAAVLPTPAGSWLALGEVLIPPVGQTITLTPYNPRTGIRHGILPVIADGSTVAGHDGAPGTGIGQYRDHPAYGLQRWNGTRWTSVAPGPRAVVTRSTSMSSAGSAETVLAFDTATARSTPGIWTGAAPTLFTCPETAEYDLALTVNWALSTNAGAVGVAYRVNGSTSVWMEIRYAQVYYFNAQHAQAKGILLNAGDNVEFVIMQNSDPSRGMVAAVAQGGNPAWTMRAVLELAVR